jgi:hypothetical protein
LPLVGKTHVDKDLLKRRKSERAKEDAHLHSYSGPIGAGTLADIQLQQNTLFLIHSDDVTEKQKSLKKRFQIGYS